MYTLNTYRGAFQYYVCGFLSLLFFLIVPYVFLFGVCLGTLASLLIYLCCKVRFVRMVVEEIRVTQQEFTKRISEFLKRVDEEMMEDLQEEECVICMENFRNGTSIFAVLCPCKDVFYHEPCITQWLLKSATCPICRKDLKAKTVIF